MKRPFDVGARLAVLAGQRSAAVDFRMRISADAEWHHQGATVRRPALVKLFASALHRALDGSYWLVTPYEAGLVDVEDVPFVIVELAVERPGQAQIIRLRTNLDEWVVLDAQHPLTMRAPNATAAPIPYMVVRPASAGGLALEARLLRSVFYHLVGLAELDEAGGELVLTSAGRRFSLGRVDHP